jgi:hypothetical protein
MEAALTAIHFFFRNNKVRKILSRWHGSNRHHIDFKSHFLNGRGIFISFVPAAYRNCPLLLYTSSDPTMVPDKVICDLISETHQISFHDDIYTTKLCIRRLTRDQLVQYKHIPFSMHILPYQNRVPTVNTTISIHEMADHLFSSLNMYVDMEFALESAFSYIERYSIVQQVNSDNRSAIFCAAVVLSVSMQSEIGQITVPMLAQLVGCMEWEELYKYALHLMQTIGWRL